MRLKAVFVTAVLTACSAGGSFEAGNQLDVAQYEKEYSPIGRNVFHQFRTGDSSSCAVHEDKLHCVDSTQVLREQAYLFSPETVVKYPDGSDVDNVARLFFGGERKFCFINRLREFYCMERYAHSLLGREINEEGSRFKTVFLYGNVRDARTTQETACVITVESKVFCIGDNRNGLAGIGEGETRINEFREVLFKEGFEPIKLFSGSRFYCAMDQNGAVFCWGSNRYKRVELAEHEPVIWTPQQVYHEGKPLTGARTIFMRGRTFWFVREDHKTVCRGKGIQLLCRGDGVTEHEDYSVLPIVGIVDIRVALGESILYLDYRNNLYLAGRIEDEIKLIHFQSNVVRMINLLEWICFEHPGQEFSCQYRGYLVQVSVLTANVSCNNLTVECAAGGIEPGVDEDGEELSLESPRGITRSDLDWFVWMHFFKERIFENPALAFTELFRFLSGRTQ